MKKPLSIQDHVKVLSLTVYPYQKIRPVFSLRTVIYEFFQKKLNYIKATKYLFTILYLRGLSASYAITRFEKSIIRGTIKQKNTRTFVPLFLLELMFCSLI